MESLNVLLASTQDPAFNVLKARAISSQQMPASEPESAVLGKRKRSDDLWRQRVVSILQPMIFQPGEEWYPRQDLNDNEWVVAMLQAVRQKLSG